MKNFWWVRIIFSGWLIYFVFSFCSKVFLVRQDTSEVCSIVSSCCNDISPTASKMKKKVIIYAHANSSSYYTSSSRQFSLSMTTFLYTSRCSPKSSITLQNFPYWETCWYRHLRKPVFWIHTLHEQTIKRKSIDFFPLVMVIIKWNKWNVQVVDLIKGESRDVTPSMIDSFTYR